MRSIVCGAALALFATFAAFGGARAQSPDVVAAADRSLGAQAPKEMLADIAGKPVASLLSCSRSLRSYG